MSSTRGSGKTIRAACSKTGTRAGAARIRPEALAVLPTDVVDVRAVALHRGETSESAVGTAVSVVIEIARERDRSCPVVDIGADVGPVAQQHADERLDLAVHARGVLGDDELTQTELTQRQ